MQMNMPSYILSCSSGLGFLCGSSPGRSHTCTKPCWQAMRIDVLVKCTSVSLSGLTCAMIRGSIWLTSCIFGATSSLWCISPWLEGMRETWVRSDTFFETFFTIFCILLLLFLCDFGLSTSDGGLFSFRPSPLIPSSWPFCGLGVPDTSPPVEYDFWCLRTSSAGRSAFFQLATLAISVWEDESEGSLWTTCGQSLQSLGARELPRDELLDSEATLRSFPLGDIGINELASEHSLSVARLLCSVRERGLRTLRASAVRSQRSKQPSWPTDPSR